jgi:hypothetical protein
VLTTVKSHVRSVFGHPFTCIEPWCESFWIAQPFTGAPHPVVVLPGAPAQDRPVMFEHAGLPLQSSP